MSLSLSARYRTALALVTSARRRGQILGSAPAVDQPGRSVLEAAVPQLELLDYAVSLRSLAHGTGTFHREHRGYEEMPERLVAQHLGERGRHA